VLSGPEGSDERAVRYRKARNRLQIALLIVAGLAVGSTAALGRWATGVVTVIAAIVLPILGVQMIGAGRDYRRGVGSQLSGESREPPNRRLVRIIWGVTALVAVVAGTLYAIVRVQLTLRH
jgi:hypothetical protein